MNERGTDASDASPDRKQVLIHHPDKKGDEMSEEDADEMFKSLTRGTADLPANLLRSTDV